MEARWRLSPVGLASEYTDKEELRVVLYKCIDLVVDMIDKREEEDS